MPPVEGLACGCIPVLRPNVGAANMYAKDGDNCLFLAEDALISATKIQKLLDDPERLPPMRKSASLSAEPFDPDQYGQRLLESVGFL